MRFARWFAEETRMDLSARRVDHAKKDLKQADVKKDRGAILVLTALVLLVILGVAALATDVGAWYRQGQEQQRSADLASLNAVQAYDEQRRAFLETNGADSIADLSLAQKELLEQQAFGAAVNSALEILRSAGIPISGIPTIVTAAPGEGNSSATVTADDGSVITIERIDGSQISVSIRATTDQYFSTLIRDAPEIERTSTATLSNCGAFCTQPLVINPPFTSFSGAGNGDGFGPLLYRETEVWAVNHHNGANNSQLNGDIICMSRETRTFCNPQGRFPIGLETHNRPVEYIDEAQGRIFFGARDRSAKQTGLACFDVIARAYCGTSFVPLFSQTGNNTYPAVINAAGPWEYAGNLYMLGQDGRMTCVNAVSLAPCGQYWNTALANNGLGRDLQTSTTIIDGEQLGSKVYLTSGANNGGKYFHCFDFQTRTPCWGGQTFAAGFGNGLTHFSYNTSGSITGICVTSTRAQNGYGHNCVKIDGSQMFQVPGLGAYARTVSGGWEGVGFTWVGEGSERRTFLPGSQGERIACWNWETGGGCGILNTLSTYGVAVQPYGFATLNESCVIGLGHRAQFFSFNPRNLGPCVDGSAESEIVPCGCADGTPLWGEIEFPANMTSLVSDLRATITNPSNGGAVVMGIEDYDILANDNKIDLTGFDSGVGKLDLELKARSKLDANGDPIWTEPIDIDLAIVVQPTLTN